MKSSWKLPYINKFYFKKYLKYKKKIFFIKYKNSVIGPNFIDKVVNIYNGRFYNTLNITSNMIGFKFGEFIPVKTSAKYLHLKRSKKKNKKNK